MPIDIASRDRSVTPADARYGEEVFCNFSLLSPVHYYNLLTTLTIIRTLDLII